MICVFNIFVQFAAYACAAGFLHVENKLLLRKRDKTRKCQTSAAVVSIVSKTTLLQQPIREILAAGKNKAMICIMNSIL